MISNDRLKAIFFTEVSLCKKKPHKCFTATFSFIFRDLVKAILEKEGEKLKVFFGTDAEIKIGT